MADQIDPRRLMLLEEGHCLKDHALAVCQLAETGMHNLSATSLETLVQLVAGKMGSTLVPEMAVASLVARFNNATGHKVGFHAWRRSGLTHLHDAGVPPGQVQAIAGHSSLATTMLYVRPSAKGRVKAIQALKAM